MFKLCILVVLALASGAFAKPHLAFSAPYVAAAPAAVVAAPSSFGLAAYSSPFAYSSPYSAAYASPYAAAYTAPVFY